MSHTDKDVSWHVTYTNPSFWAGEDHSYCTSTQQPCRISEPTWWGCHGILPWELQRSPWNKTTRRERHLLFWDRDRAHTRDTLRTATKRYRAGDDLDDITLLDQHRRGTFGGGYMN